MKTKKMKTHNIMKIIMKNGSYGCDIKKFYSRHRYKYTKSKNKLH